MEKYISVSKEGMERLKEAFKVGERCVKNALTFRSDNDLARKIRYGQEPARWVHVLRGERDGVLF